MFKKQILLGGIYVYLFGEDHTVEHPYTHVIWVTHGRGGKVEDVFDICERLLLEACHKRHVLIVALEERNHGSRQIDSHRNQSWNINVAHPSDLYALMIGMMYDIQSCIDILPLYIATVSRDQLQIAVVGVSLGAHIALLCATHLERVNAAVSIMGSANFQELIKLRFEHMKRMLIIAPSKFGPEPLNYFQRVSSETSPISDALKELCHVYDPIYHIEQLKEKYVLMLSGDKDTVVPAVSQFHLYETMMRQFPECASRIVYHIEKDAKHQMTDGMRHKTIEFIQKWISLTNP